MLKKLPVILQTHLATVHSDRFGTETVQAGGGWESVRARSLKFLQGGFKFCGNGQKISTRAGL